MTSAPSEMDEGTPEVGESFDSSEAPILIPPPQPLSTPSPPYEVGVMRRSLGHRGVHPYHDAVFQSIPRRVAGQPFQQWLALTRTAHRFPTGDLLGCISHRDTECDCTIVFSNGDIVLCSSWCDSS